MTTRLRLDLAYDGAGFSGWAAQPGLRTVQGTLEHALATVLRVPEAAVTCAGRTDAGVHARGQVVHLDVPEETLRAAAGRSPAPAEETLQRRLGGVLPRDVRVRAVTRAPDGFDARFSALWRRYVYRISDDTLSHDPLTRGFVLARRRSLDPEAMDRAAAPLLGEHDFAAFCKHRPGATTVRRLLALQVERDPAGVLLTHVRADAFCHHMVRALVGALVAVGEGRHDPGWVAEVLSAGERDPAVEVLPAHGLVLEEVAYPGAADLAARARETRQVRTGG